MGSRMSCYADPDPIFSPAMRLISTITTTNPITITTTFDHGYLSGLIVRIKIPRACMMEELDNYTGPITVTGSNTFTLDLDGTAFTPFDIPVTPNPIWDDICAQVIPIGELNNQYTQALSNTL